MAHWTNQNTLFIFDWHMINTTICCSIAWWLVYSGLWGKAVNALILGFIKSCRAHLLGHKLLIIGSTEPNISSDHSNILIPGCFMYFCALYYPQVCLWLSFSPDVVLSSLKTVTQYHAHGVCSWNMDISSTWVKIWSVGLQLGIWTFWRKISKCLLGLP